MEILKVINSNESWEEILTSPPFNLVVKRDGEYLLIKYNQISSDFKEQIVREARGIILKQENGKYKLVCVPFTKFFCFGDPNAKNDLDNLYKKDEWLLEEKIDGSLIKLWYDNEKWNVSTNGTIDAEKATLQSLKEDIFNYKQLFMKASKGKINYDLLDKNYTYLFELVGLENKVIVPYNNTDIYYLGKRNNITLEEISYFLDNCKGLEKCNRPKCELIKVDEPIKDIEKIKEKASKLNGINEHFEGYVLADVDLKSRIKIKSDYYMELFHIKGEGIFTPRKILSMILQHKEDDLLSFFPEYISAFDEIRGRLIRWINKVKQELEWIKTQEYSNRKEYADIAKNMVCPQIMFKAYEREIDEDWLEEQINAINIDKLLNYIGIEM